MERVYLGCSCCQKSVGLCGNVVLEGYGVSTEELSSSSEVLKVNRWCTGLQCDWLVPVLHGVTGSREMCSLLRTWWIFNVLLREEGMLKFSLLLS